MQILRWQPTVCPRNTCNDICRLWLGVWDMTRSVYWGAGAQGLGNCGILPRGAPAFQYRPPVARPPVQTRTADAVLQGPASPGKGLMPPEDHSNPCVRNHRISYCFKGLQAKAGLGPRPGPSHPGLGGGGSSRGHAAITMKVVTSPSFVDRFHSSTLKCLNTLRYGCCQAAAGRAEGSVRGLPPPAPSPSHPRPRRWGGAQPHRHRATPQSCRHPAPAVPLAMAARPSSTVPPPSPPIRAAARQPP